MFDSDPTPGDDWQPDGWDLEVPTEEASPNHDGYTGGVDPDFLRPDDSIVHQPEAPDAPHETLVLDEVGDMPPTPEQIRGEVKDKCLLGVYEYVEAMHQHPERFQYNDVASVLHGMVSEAIHNDNVPSAAAHITLLESLHGNSDKGLFKTHFAGALIGDVKATALVHQKLETEQINGSFHQQVATSERGDDVYEPPNTPLHYAIIEQCVSYDVHAGHWIDTYAVDADDRWAKTAYYLRLRLEKAGSGADAVERQKALDSHMARIGDVSPLLVMNEMPKILQRATDPVVRGQLVDRFITDVSDAPVSFQNYKTMMRVGSMVLDDPLLMTDRRHDFFKQVHKEQPSMFSGQQRYMSVLDASYPFTEARMHREGYSLQQIIEMSDKMAEVSFKALGKHADIYKNVVMAHRDGRLASSARRFAREGNFESAQALLTAMLPSDTHRVTQAACLDMATTPDQIVALRIDDALLASQPHVAMQYEIASLRVSGNADELTANAAAHADVTRQLRLAAATGGDFDREDLADHRRYVDLAQDAVAKMGTEQFTAFAAQLLPILRDLDEHSTVLRPLSDALILSGDPDEPQRAYDYAGRRSRLTSEVRAESLWHLAKTLHRAG